MNIVLTGLRGSGKTQIGKLLAKKLKWKFIDLDNEIEKEEKTKIKNIIDLKGWDYFRTKETEITKKIAKLNETIISTGGGTIINTENKKELKKNGKIIYLYRTPEDCCKYIKNDLNRPPLTDMKTKEEEMEEVYKERNERYCKSAHIILKRTKDIEKDTKTLIKKLKAMPSLNLNS
jgi:shikimate kinase